ncbi:MAG: DegT/DnrJ/EryC1/StrS family aminotransferase [archaeon]
MEKECSGILKKLTNKKHVLFVKRGNTAVKLCLLLAKSLGRKKILIQDQGGWITFPQYINKLKLEQIDLKTDHGLVLPITLTPYKSDSAFMIHSAPAYCCLQPMKEILQICKQNNILFFNDATGSVGTDRAKHGDIVFLSFGQHKPINMGHGACIATDNPDFYKFLKQNNPEFHIDFDGLYDRLRKLDKRLGKLSEIHKKVKEDLRGFNIVHREHNGINVIVKFDNEEQKQNLIDYCKANELDYRECPCYIKIKDPAISIEVKRK